MYHSSDSSHGEKELSDVSSRHPQRFEGTFQVPLRRYLWSLQRFAPFKDILKITILYPSSFECVASFTASPMLGEKINGGAIEFPSLMLMLILMLKFFLLLLVVVCSFLLLLLFLLHLAALRNS